MGGVRRTKGCVNCRESKVKCDERLPICSRCERLNRRCSHFEKFQFINGTATSQSDSSASNWHISAPTKQRTYAFTTERLTDNGALIQKWHCTTIPRGPDLARNDRQSKHLIGCLEFGPMGSRMKWIGKWMTFVPQRIGSSSALYCAVQLATSTRIAMLHDGPPSLWINSKAYGRAIKALREALADPTECMSAETLAATTILYYLEVVLRPPSVFNAVHHAGGISRLLEIRGPTKIKSDFEIALIRELRGPIISNSVLLGIPCFLTSPQWTKVFEIDGMHLGREAWKEALAEQTMHWSELASGIRKHCSSQLSSVEVGELNDRLSRMKHFLDSIDNKIREDLASEASVVVVKSILEGPSLGQAFDFKEHSLAVFVTMHAALTLVVGRMIHVLSQRAMMTPALGPWTSPNPQLLIRIFRTYEYASKLRPMGSAFIHLPLIMAFPHAKTEEMRAWILQAMNDLNKHRLSGGEGFTDKSLMYLAMSFTGEAAPFVPEMT